MEKTKKIALYEEQLMKIGDDEIDKDLLYKITTFLGPSIFDADAELVACGEDTELETVKHNFLKIKLGLEDMSDEKLDKAILDICEQMQEHRRKYRPVFYYLLTLKFHKQSLF